MAFASLFLTEKKLNYTKLIIHFLVLLIKYPQVKELLHIAGLINLTRKGYYYIFNKILEFFEVKFIK